MMKLIKKIYSSETYKKELNEMILNISLISEVSKDKIKENILKNDYLLSKIIKPGQLGSIRGNVLNNLVLELAKLILKDLKCEIKREYQHPEFNEKLDLYINFKDKELCIYNQLDLCGGGAQFNRYEKYLKNKNNKLLLIVVNPFNLSFNSKYYNLIITNINKKLIWIKDFKMFLVNYFKIKYH